jgi:hypothetical protein
MHECNTHIVFLTIIVSNPGILQGGRGWKPEGWRGFAASAEEDGGQRSMRRCCAPILRGRGHESVILTSVS